MKLWVQILRSYRQLGSSAVVHHVQQRVRLPDHVNTDNILKPHAEGKRMTMEWEEMLVFRLPYIYKKDNKVQWKDNFLDTF